MGGKEYQRIIYLYKEDGAREREREERYREGG